SAAGCWTARATRWRTRWWRPGRPTPRGGSPTPTTPVARGRSRGRRFRALGRCPTDAKGRWAIRTVKPGPLPAPDGGTEAPHLDVSVFARGLLGRLVTR